MVKKYNQSDIIISLLLFTHVLAWILYMPMSQIQLLLLGSRIITFIHYGIIEMLLIILLAFKKGKIRFGALDKSILSIILLLAIPWFFNIVMSKDVTSFTALFYLMYWIFPFVVIIIINQYKYDITGFLKFMLGIVVIHGIIIWYQRFTNTIFWPFTVLDDGSTLIKVQTFYHKGSVIFRCIGLCTTGLDAGILLMFGIILTMIRKNIKRWCKISLYLFFCISIYFSGTRNVYVTFLFVVGIVFLVKYIKLARSGRVLVFVTIVSCLVYLGVILNIDSSNETGYLMTDTSSIGIRLKKWEEVISEVTTVGIITPLFGTMKWQNAGNSHIIDNIYLELLYCSGVLALLAYIKFIFNAAIFECKMKSPNSLFCAGFTLAYCVYGVLNSTTNFYLTLIIILLFYCKHHSLQEISEK